jgi:peptidase E
MMIYLSNFDLVYIGGNTFKLLIESRESGLENKILTYFQEGGKVY